jgi:acyl-CoA reductase-like NAD-dependent aldehyde dehydrogenase
LFVSWSSGLLYLAMQLLNGDAAVGRQLVTDPIVRCVHFTGSAQSGRLVVPPCLFCPSGVWE